LFVPVILFLTGRLYIWSMGLLALAIDVFIFLLLSYLAPAVWQVGGTRASFPRCWAPCCWG
jgi:hypothetical protein